MKDQPELTDEKIMLITKAALDNNAAIIQFCSFIYGHSKDIRESSRKQWHKQLKAQWKSYQKQVEDILSSPSP